MPQIQVKDANSATQTIGYYANTGQTTKSGSIPVTLASDQDPVSVSVATNSVVTLSTSSAVSLTSQAVVTLNTTQLASLPTIALQSLGVTELLSIDNKIPALSTSILDSTSPAQPVRPVPYDIWKVGFSESGAGLVSSGMTLMSTGTGMAVSQSQSNLVVTSGTNTKTETLIRSVAAFKGGLFGRMKLIASQRIVNQMAGMWLADLVGTGLAYTVDATGYNVTVTFASNPFTSVNIGQAVNIGAISGTGTPGRYVITAVAGSTITLSAIFSATWARSTTTATVTLVGGGGHEIIIGGGGIVSASSDTAAIVNGAVTVTGGTGTTFTFTCLNAGASSGTLTYQNTDQTFLANSSGTCSLWGWNNMHALFRDGSATTGLFDSQRRGWGATDTSSTVNTTATGTVIQIQSDGYLVDFIDSTVASSASTPYAARASRTENIPDVTDNLYLFINFRNFALAPATSTTYTIGFVSVESIPNQKMYLAGASFNSPLRGLQIQNVQAVPTTTVQPTASTSTGGVSTYHHLISAATTNATSVKTSAGSVISIVVTNSSAAIKYFKLYNKSSAPTVGTDTPILTLGVGAGQTVSYIPPVYSRLATGIAYALTGGIAVADTTAVALNDLSVHISYA